MRKKTNSKSKKLLIKREQEWDQAELKSSRSMQALERGRDENQGKKKKSKK